jgi:UDPglucose 6-dehydrogenase
MTPRVGFIGLGKLGLPVALAIDSFGFDVCGTDINLNVLEYLLNKQIPYKEELADDLLKVHKIGWYKNMGDVIRNSDVIFIPIQTPHEARYEGITRLPPERKDFDYTYLRKAISDFVVQMALSSDPSPKTLVIISTVLPGTLRREIIPLIKDDKRINLVYNPFFIAMGTTIHDFLNPEFVLLGTDSKVPMNLFEIYYKIYNNCDCQMFKVMSIESAELTKVAYNTFITSKICIVNTLMEICHKIPGANIDDVTGALKNATKRIVSPMYMNGGMGDGGGCHPRDNIAMSYLAKNLTLSYDWFEHLMISREKQAEFFVSLIEENYSPRDKVYILGYEFKPKTNLTTGAHALLVASILQETTQVDFEIRNLDSALNKNYWLPETGKLIFFMGCKHEEFLNFHFPSGSVIIDPFRYIPDQPGCKVIRVGE